ncbi:MAG: DMT family transporter [Bacteroidota bacterium]|nr:DMT family transporter [Bacteroidota bacterium]
MNLPLVIGIQQLVASSTHVVARSVVTAVPATTVVLYRGILSVLAYAGWIALRRTPPVMTYFRAGDWWRFALLGLVNMPLNQYLFVAGLAYTTPPNAALAFALSPVFVLIMARILLGERWTRPKLIGIILAVIGAGIVAIGRGARLGTDALLGNIMELAASCAWSLYTVWGRPLVQRYGAVITTAGGMLWGLVLFVPVAALVPGGIVTPFSLSLRAWLEIAYLGIITSGVGWALWYMLLRHMEASRLAVFNNLQPLLTVLLAWIVFGELPPGEFWVGGSIAIAGVVLTQRG